MTSSGTSTFQITNGEAAIAAFERIQIRLPELRPEHWSTARREENLLFSELSNRQVNLFSVQRASIDLVEGVATYDIPDKTVMLLDVVVSLNNGTANQTDRYITPISRTQYMSIANKSTQGPPTVYWYDRLIDVQVKLWPVPDSSSLYVLNYYAAVQIEDANLAGGETPGVPYLWYDVVVAGLAWRLARVYKPELEGVRKADFDLAWQWAAEQNSENVPFTVSLNLGGYYRR